MTRASVLVQAVCTVLCTVLCSGDLPAQILSEIMYHPREETAQGVEDKRYEWLEIYNQTTDPVDLSGYTFRGVDFTFAPGTYLAPRAYLVVCADQGAVRTKYGISNTIGNWNPSTALDNSGERISLTTNSGVVISTVSYNDRAKWPAGADGTGHSLAIRDPYLEVDDPDSWALSPTLGGSPGGPNFGGQSTFRDTTLFGDADQDWTYLKGRSAPPANWNTYGFSDAGWLEGTTRPGMGIGYGDGDDAIVLDDMMGAGGYLTVYCRTHFELADPAAVERLILTVSYDDGFVAYLNGVELPSRNVTSKAFDAPATATVGEASPEDIDITAFKDALRAGDNVLAAQVHNAGPGSTDVSFIAKLVSREVISPESVATVPVVFNEALLRTTGERWVELFNTSRSPVSLEGFYLTDDRRNLTKARLPAGTSISGRGWRAFSDVELGLNFSLSDPVPRDRVLVALVNPAGSRVVDAYTWRPAVDELSEARTPDGDEDVAPAAQPTRGAPDEVDLVGGGDVVINEIMYHPLSDDPGQEFIELYNRGASPVQMEGFRLERAVEFLFPSHLLAPGGYLVVARDPERIVRNYGLSSSIVLGPWYRERQDAQGNPVREPAALADGGERVTLLDPRGNIADTVRYHEGGEWPFWPDGRGSSLELIDPFQDNNTGQAWDSSDDSAESDLEFFTYTARHGGGESELQILLLDRGITVVDNVSVKLNAAEYMSNGTFDAASTGWRMEGTHVASGRTTDPELVIAGSGSLKVVATGGGDNKVNRIESNPDLSPPLGTASLYTVSLTARWVVGAQVLMTKGYNHGLARTHLLPVPITLGTPGEINSVTQRQIERETEANLGPLIDKVTQDPVVPEGGQSVTVSARIRDSDGVRPGTPRLFYALNTPPASPSGFTGVAMSDSDGDGVYTATIPGQATLGTRVLFYITAQDDSPRRVAGRYPLDHVSRTHPTLLNPGSATLRDHRYAIYRHDTRLPSTRYQSYRFVMHQANQDYLFNRPVHSNDLVDGTFIFEADRGYYGARIRWAGSPWLRGRSWGNSYRLRSPTDQPFHGTVESLNLENHSTQAQEGVSAHLLRHNNVPGIKVPYADQWLVRWQVNDQVNSTYAAVPQPDNEYISRWYPEEDNGDFFEMDDRFEFNDNGDRVSNQDGRLTFPPWTPTLYPVPDPAEGYRAWKENYRWYLNVRAKPNADDFTALVEFSRILDPTRTTAAVFDTEIWNHADVESMLRVWAVRLNTDDWDTWGAARGKNCYLYRRSATGLWVLVPWDMELTYGNPDAFPLGANPSQPIPINGLFPEVNRMLNRPRIKRMYYGILKEMVDRQFNAAFLTPWMDLLQQNGWGGTGIGRTGGFIEQRAARIRSWINPAVYPQQRLVITTSSGNPFSTPEITVDVAGNAPVEVMEIVVTRNGEVLDPQPQVSFSTSNMIAWTARGIPLLPGVNRLAFLGYGSEDDLFVDSDSVDVTSTASQNPPALEVVVPAEGSTGAEVTLTGSEFRTGLKVFFGAAEASATFNEANPTRIIALVPVALAPGATAVKVRNPDGRESNEVPFTVKPGFIRGDGNMDGQVDLSDAVKTLLVLFVGASSTCQDALDVDDDGELAVADPIRLLNHLFRNGPAPAAPHPAKGLDPTTADPLTCAQGL